MIRLRRHTDGRVALSLTSASWFVAAPYQNQRDAGWVAGYDVAGPGWSELLVAELPEPDGYRRPSADDPFWALSFASQQLTAHAGEVSVMYTDGIDVAYARYRTQQELDDLRADGLRILAAVAACDQEAT